MSYVILFPGMHKVNTIMRKQHPNPKWQILYSPKSLISKKYTHQDTKMAKKLFQIAEYSRDMNIKSNPGTLTRSSFGGKSSWNKDSTLKCCVNVQFTEIGNCAWVI